MPSLYLVWNGTGGSSSLYGISTSSFPPNFQPPQVEFNSALFPIGKPALLALTGRILMAYAYSSSVPGLFGGTTSGMAAQTCQSWPNWTNNGVNGSSSAWGPSLASWPGGALMVWNGLGSDTRVWTAIYHQAQDVWSPQYLTQLEGTGKPIQTGSTPAIANFNGKLLMVWVGEGGNDNLYYATSADGIHWQGNKGIPGAASSIAPSLIIYNGAPVICFKGPGSDHNIYTSTYEASIDYWTPVALTGNYGTSYSPGLAIYNNALFMTWRGINDTGIYWATTTNPNLRSSWTAQSAIPGVGSSTGPSAVVF